MEEEQLNIELEEITDDISDVRLIDIPGIIIFVALFVIVSLQFFTRYILNDSLGWTEEIARYFLILLTFVGGITCVRKGSHIFLSFLYQYFPVRWIKGIAVFCDTVSFGFLLYCGWLAIELAQRTGSRMASINLPKSIIYYTVAGGCFVMAVYALINLVRLSRKSGHEVADSKLSISNSTL